MNKIKSRAISLLSILTVMIAFFITPTTTLAANVNWNKVADYVSTWHIKSLNGLHWTDDGVYMIKSENEPAFCIEHGVQLTGGAGFNPSELTSPEKEELSLIAYYGYQINPTVENYGITQAIIWEKLGDELLTTNLPNYQNRKAEILKQVSEHKIKPSFDNKTVTLNVGDSVTLTDTNNSLTRYTKLVTNTANLTIKKNGSKLTLTATPNSKELGKIQYNIADNKYVGQSFVYKKPNEQNVVTFKLANAGSFTLNIKVNLNGNIKVKKVDDETGQALASTKLKLEYNNTSKDVETDKNGIAELKDITAGTKVKITEVTAPNGYINKGLSQEVIVKPNQTIEVTLKNSPQKGLLKLSKTGQQISKMKITDTEYGKQYQLIFDYLPLANTSFEIKATEDIVSGGVVQAKKGEVVASVKTDNNGELINMPTLYLGKYEAIELNAPDGFLVNKTPIPFSFSYGGQEIDLVSTALKVQNNFQKLNLILHKDEEKLTDWKENQPILETVPSNDKIFGLFMNQTFQLSDQSIVPKDSLLTFDSVKDEKLSFNTQLPKGKYYVKELNAGNQHNLDTTHYEVDYAPTSDSTEQTIDIYQANEGKSPLLNKLHFNNFSLKKVNEEAKLNPKQGYDFTYTGNGEGAEFTLMDEKDSVIQKVNKESVVTFSHIPVGTFYLKETQPSTENYLLSTEKYKIVSTLRGIDVFDSKDKLMASSFKRTEQKTPSLFEVKNLLIIGGVELTKTDVSSGKPLPNTSVQILDSKKNIVIEGQTDDKGKFSFDKLPAGQYYFREFNAPNGYELDETPVPFEIKKDGEVVQVKMTNRMTPTDTKLLPQTGEKNSLALLVIGGILLSGLLAHTIYKYKKSKEEQ